VSNVVNFIAESCWERGAPTRSADAPAGIGTDERTSQKLGELLTQGVGDGDACAELLKLAVRKIVEEALERRGD
jgi:hypothetical protein